MTDAYMFGYPRECDKCKNLSHSIITGPKVKPFFKDGSGPQLMLIGQDPTIYRKPERVKYVLMLNEEHGQLSRWLMSLLGENNYRRAKIYATNLIKCPFSVPPSSAEQGGYRFLLPYFENCKSHLYLELTNYRPSLVLVFGEPAHRMFKSTLDNSHQIADSMKDAFTDKFVRAIFANFEFDYSPCLHIKTYRVADTYGEKVKAFNSGILKYFGRS